MNKRQLNKEIKDAARNAGVRISRGDIKAIMDAVTLIGAMPVAVEVIKEHDCPSDPVKQGNIGPGHCPEKKLAPQYIGTKIVRAEPALRIEEAKGTVVFEPLCNHPVTLPTDTVDVGYNVYYPDGYESWCPQDVFEEAYRPTDGMNFGLALEAAKMGKRIARAGWNGKGQYVELGRRLIYATHDGCGVEAQHEDIGSQALVFVGTRGSQVGWLASQSDMLADDWYIVDEE